MPRLDNWLYHYFSMYVHDLLQHAVALLVPDLVYRPVLQRVRSPRAWHRPTQMR
jgi:hypothetical protein